MKTVTNLKKFVDKTSEPYGEFWPQKRFTEVDLKQMYAMFERYYENTSFDLFVSDFRKKTGALVVLLPKSNEIVGFSTIMNSHIKVKGKTYHAIFSGDTVVDKQYWGSRALPQAMYKYMIKQVLKTPLTPVYWMLISKGFKTYLLLTNNYFMYYPNRENKHRYLKDVVDAYCMQMFPKYYNTELGILDFGDDYQPLKGDVAPITDAMRRKTPNIAYFEQCNPEWERGTELACIAQLSVADIYRYFSHWLGKSTSAGKAEADIAKTQQIQAIKDK